MSALRPFLALAASITLLCMPLGCGTEAGDGGSQSQPDITTPTPDVPPDATPGPDVVPTPDTSPDATQTCHGCTLEPDGDHRAGSKISIRTSTGTRWSRKPLTERRSRTRELKLSTFNLSVFTEINPVVIKWQSDFND